jgi:hypothetical protein
LVHEIVRRERKREIMAKVRKRGQPRSSRQASNGSSKKKRKTGEKEYVGGGGRGKNDKDLSSSFKKPVRDEELLSEEDEFDNGAPDIPSSPDEGEDAAELETADEKRLRLAKAYLDRTRQSVADAEEDEDED